MPRRWKLLLWIGSISILLDQVTKFWARSALKDGPIVVVEGYWDFVLAYNTGAAFSMFENLGSGRVVLSIIALVAIGAIVSMVHKAEDSQTGFIVALSLMAGGALGNVMDRLAMGKVTDFVLWRYQEHAWPVFNVADIALSVAVGLFIIVAYRDWKASKNNPDTGKADTGKSGSKAAAKS